MLPKKSLSLFFILTSLCAFTQTVSFTYDGVLRNYIIHLPTGYNSANKYPLVFNLHGYTSNATEQQLYSMMDVVANNEGFIVVYPNGIANYWNSGFTGVYGTGTDDVGFISAIIDSMNANYSIDLQRVYSCGMSNGGFQSYRMACELEDRIAAVASVTGSMSDSTYFYCSTSRTVPVMQIHGTTDPVVPYGGTFGMKPIEDVVSFWTSSNNCSSFDTTEVSNISLTDSCTADFIRITNCDYGTENWFYKIYNGGHTWPSGLIDIPTNGNTNRDINASQRIWDFFSMYTLSSGTSNIREIQTETTLWPNPAATGAFTVESEKSFDACILYAIDGRALHKEHFTPAFSKSINVAGLAHGVYVLHLINQGRILNQLKLVVQDF